MTKEQPKNAITTLLNENIRLFASAFCDSSRELFVDRDGQLVHPGEFGTFREALTCDYLKAFVPQRLGIDSGFVVTASGKISSQCDIVIYDRSVTPLIQNANRQKFFPVESVCAVGEVKSVLTLSKLKSTLRKLAEVKMLRDSLSSPSYVHCSKIEGASKAIFAPERDELDQFVTFLVCERFDFDLQQNAKEILNCYVETSPIIPVNLRHNMVLSIENGLLTYIHKNDDLLYPFPMKSTVVVDYEGSSEPKSSYIKGKGLRNRFVIPCKGSFEHIRHFSTMFHQSLSTVSIFFPDMGLYVQPQDDVQWIDHDYVRGF